MAIAFCKICESDKEIVSDDLLRIVREKQWLIELKCGHIFDWESGRCYTKEYFDKPLRLAPPGMLLEDADYGSKTQ